jgi:hypothetical protein
MVFSDTFNNISVILWRSVLLMAETGVSGVEGVAKHHKTYQTINSLT